MSVNRIRQSALVAASQVTCEGLGLLRNIILARALGPEQMGILATLAVTLSLLDMVSDFGPDRLLIQAEDGDEPAFQATSQFLLLIRGMVCGGLLGILAIPIAYWTGSSQIAWMIAALGLVSGLRGLMHLDGKRMQRNHDFRTSMISELASSVLTTVVVFLAWPTLRDASAFVWISLLQAGILVVTSHCFASRSWQLTCDPAIARRLWKFGLPLAINSLIMFGALQGDRLVVLASATAADLGRYAIAFQLTMVPTLLVSRIATTIFLPAFARSQNSPVAFSQQLDQVAMALGLISIVFVAGLTWNGNLLIGSLYGPHFQLSPAVMSCLVVMQGLRILRTLPSLVALSRADSLNPLASNLLRLVGIAAAAIVGLGGWGLAAIAAAGCAGELVALAGSAWLLQSRQKINPAAIWINLGLFGVVSSAVWLTTGSTSHITQFVGVFTVISVLIIAVARILLSCRFEGQLGPLPSQIQQKAS